MISGGGGGARQVSSVHIQFAVSSFFHLQLAAKCVNPATELSSAGFNADVLSTKLVKLVKLVLGSAPLGETNGKNRDFFIISFGAVKDSDSSVFWLLRRL